MITLYWALFYFLGIVITTVCSDKKPRPHGKRKLLQTIRFMMYLFCYVKKIVATRAMNVTNHRKLFSRFWKERGKFSVKLKIERIIYILTLPVPIPDKEKKKERKRRVKDKKFLRKSEIKVIEAKEYHHCKGSAARIICHSLKGIHYGLSEKVI